MSALWQCAHSVNLTTRLDEDGVAVRGPCPAVADERFIAEAILNPRIVLREGVHGHLDARNSFGDTSDVRRDALRHWCAESVGRECGVQLEFKLGPLFRKNTSEEPKPHVVVRCVERQPQPRREHHALDIVLIGDLDSKFSKVLGE